MRAAVQHTYDLRLYFAFFSYTRRITHIVFFFVFYKGTWNVRKLTHNYLRVLTFLTYTRKIHVFWSKSFQGFPHAFEQWIDMTIIILMKVTKHLQKRLNASYQAKSCVEWFKKSYNEMKSDLIETSFKRYSVSKNLGRKEDDHLFRD